MRLYLMRHGQAVPAEIDPDRPLDARGRDDVDRMARFLARHGVRIDAIYHSGKTRSRETAERLAAELRPEQGLAPMEVLAPNDDPGFALEVVDALGAPTMLVGHLPHLGRLASRLVIGADEPEIVEIPTAATVCLDRRDDGGWSIAWVIPPELAG